MTLEEAALALNALLTLERVRADEDSPSGSRNQSARVRGRSPPRARARAYPASRTICWTRGPSAPVPRRDPLAAWATMDRLEKDETAQEALAALCRRHGLRPPKIVVA